VEIESDPKKRDAGRTVLVVDDNATIRKLLAAAFLSDSFKTCAEAENGKEASIEIVCQRRRLPSRHKRRPPKICASGYAHRHRTPIDGEFREKKSRGVSFGPLSDVGKFRHEGWRQN
jgi:hypothetical protein